MRKVEEVNINGVSLKSLLEEHELWLNSDNTKGKRLELIKADLDYVDFSGLKLDCAMLIGSSLNGADFSKASLNGVNFNRALLNKSVFIKANLKDASFYSAEMQCAQLEDCCLENADFARAYLGMAKLDGSDLSYANFNWAVAKSASLENTNCYRTVFTYANLSYSFFQGAKIFSASFESANLSNSTFFKANIKNPYFSGTNLSNTCFMEATLEDVRYNNITGFYALQCPEEGSFIGFKKGSCGEIIKLLIPEDAKRSSSTSRKCRCSKAKVLSITNIDGTKEYKIASSGYDSNFEYVVGEMVEVDDFDENRWNECSTGIHFFITREEAVRY